MSEIFLTFYFGLLAVLSVHGLHILWLIYQRWCNSPWAEPLPAPAGDPCLPRVTVQIPVYNEKPVIQRILSAVVALEYPRDRLEIQILDDSTDETRDIVKKAAKDLLQRGFDIALLQRDSRAGFKAGALGKGAACAKGELVAVFDADFVPDPDFLLRVVPCFDDPEVGMTQVRWGHLNEEQSFLTRLQALFLDSHFVMESETRNRAGLFLTFNGTGGVWRKECIEQAGGWQADTLTEDLDLSYRAQLAGWKFRFLNKCEAPAELPSSIEAFKSQQYRWTRGAAETLRKLGPSLLMAKIPLRCKVEVFFHLTSHLVFPALLLLSLCAYPALTIRLQGSIWKFLCLDLPLYLLGIFSVNLFYVWAQRVLYPGNWKRILRIPGLLFLGTGLAVSNTLAVWDAYRASPAIFERTPKTGGARRSPYRSIRSKSTWMEILLALYLSYCMAHAVVHGLWGSIPFVMVFALGFGGMGVVSLVERWQACLERQDCWRPLRPAAEEGAS